MQDKCDMCGSKIEDSKCDCGIWKSKEERNAYTFGDTLDEFHLMNQFLLTADAPHLGCAMILFRGDYNDCEKVKKFIYNMKNRPYYGDLKQ